MGTTTKMSIPYPEATGLVKDGWEDMKDIATQVDAKSGLVLLNTTSPSAVASQSINDVFNSNFKHYRILINLSSSGTGGVGIRMRVSGADNTNADYNFQRIYGQSGTVGGVRQNTFTYWEMGFLTNNFYRCSMDLFNPFETIATSGNAIAGASLNSTPELDLFVFGLDVTTSYTGFTVYPVSGGTITGDIKTYGYN